MKKFLILSAVLGVAGLGVGVAYQPGSSPATVVAQAPEGGAALEPTTSTTAPPATATTAKAPVKAKTTATTAKATTAPTAARVAVAPTTSTTSAPQPTTTTMPVVTTPTPTCSISADKATVGSPDYQQTLRLTSNMPNAPVKLSLIYPARPGSADPRSLQGTTDAAGSATWEFPAFAQYPGTVRVSTTFVGVKGGSGVCSTSFQLS